MDSAFSDIQKLYYFVFHDLSCFKFTKLSNQVAAIHHEARNEQRIPEGGARHFAPWVGGSMLQTRPSLSGHV